MPDRHAVQAMLRAGKRPRRIATHCGISVRMRITREPAARRARRIGRPPVQTAVSAVVRGWLEEEPDLSPGELHRWLLSADI